MQTRGLQMSLATLLMVVACIALNLWFFRLHVVLGLISLNISKHVLVAGLCRALGVNRLETHDGATMDAGLTQSNP
jgi:hypothetical protein